MTTSSSGMSNHMTTAGDSDNNSVMIGVTAGVILAILVAILIIVCVIIMYRRKKKRSVSYPLTCPPTASGYCYVQLLQLHIVIILYVSYSYMAVGHMS